MVMSNSHYITNEPGKTESYDADLSSKKESSAEGGVRPKKKKVKLQLKAPTQERSRQTVATILEACAKLMIREGFFGVTTDKIAKEAGVSIGSLYQFFGNKESVVSAVIVDLFEKDMRIFNEKMKNFDHLPQEDKVRALIESGLHIYNSEVELRSKIQNIYQYLVDQSYYNNLMKVYEDYISKIIPHHEGRDPKLMAKLTVHGFIGMMENIVQENKDFHSDKKLTDEIIRLFTGYLSQKW